MTHKINKEKREEEMNHNFYYDFVWRGSTI
jgi:hypothetical protein